MLVKRGTTIRFFCAIILLTAWMSGCVLPEDFQKLEIAVIELQNRQRKTQEQLNDLESRLETQKQILAVEIQNFKKEGEPVKKHLADMFSRLESMETRIQQVTGLSDEDRYRFQQIVGGLKNLDQSVQRKFTPMEQQIKSLETQMKTVLESYQTLITQMREIVSLQKSAMGRLAMVEREATSAASDQTKTRPKPQPKKPPVPKVPEHQRLYQIARGKMEKGDYASARQMFKEFLSKYPKENLAPNAQYWIGETYYNQGKYEDAILQFDKVVKNYPKSSKVPGAILKEAMAFCKMGDKEGCILFLNKVFQDYPKSPEAAKAAKELKELK